MKKIIIAFLCSVAVVGFAVYEAKSMVTKEYERQDGILQEVREDINLSLDMIKVAVVTGDTEMYEKYISGLREGANKIRSLFLVEKDTLVTELDDYSNLLEEKESLLAELNGVKESVAKLQSEFSEKYGNKDEITKDKVKAAKDEILGLKIDDSAFTEERTLTIVKTINAVIGEAAGKVGAVADCIDTCYKNRINEINNELASVFGSFSENVKKMNLEFEEEFNFEEMEKLKAMYNESEEVKEEDEEL